MTKKKRILTKTVMAAAVASSVFAVSNSADAASVTEAEKAVVKAEKLAGALKWEVSIEHRKNVYPNNLVGYPNMKLHNDTKKALADATKLVSTLKGKEKEVLQARLDANVSTYLKRSVAYIDAVSSGLKIQKKYVELKAKFDKGQMDDQTEKLYHEVSWEIKKNSFMLDRVYGVTTREEFRDFYKETAEDLQKELLYPVSIKMQIDRAAKALKDNNVDQAAGYLGNVEYLVNEAANNGADVSDKLFVSAMSKLDAAEEAFEKKGTLYFANSKTETTEFGPETGSETVEKSVYIYAGKDEHIKLQNFSINGNLVVLGSPAGAGTVSLENIKVNKVNNVGGNIIVEDIADHSLYLKGVEADSVVVNDANGSNLVAESGVKVKSLVVSEKAGAKGAVNLESKVSGAFESITIAAKGSEKSEGVNLKGDLSTTAVTVTGENAKIAVAEGATVKEIKLNAVANVAVAKGSTVKEIKKDPSVKGEVKVDNKGTVEKAEEGIEVGGNAPVVVAPPAAPAPGTGTGGGAIVTPVLDTITTGLVGEVLTDYHNGTYELDLSDVEDSDIFERIQITSSPSSSVSLKVNSLTARGASDWIDSPIQFTGTNITTRDLFGSLDTGAPGIKMENMRAVFAGTPIVLTGVLVHSSGGQTSEITVTINLGVGQAAVTTFTNTFGTITKVGNDKITVAINSGQGSTTIGTIENSTNVDFSQLLISFNSDATPDDASSLEQAIRNRFANKLLENITLGELKGKSFSANGFEIEFLN
ncbi:hypothetical protein ACFYKX_14035 [Cytobacillus sp. FJAT-54145]|uniref:SbsC C-terminal domain-containing protein n=1 Tax=Cytobacillus spartinae TaxID=3299023 RepID=A0ABW6KEP7_9BACI